MPKHPPTSHGRASADRKSLEITDGLVHFVDFFQETAGIETLLRFLEEASVHRAVVCGLPVTKMWAEWEHDQPHDFLDDDSHLYFYSHTDEILAREIEKLPIKSRRVFAPLVCGFNPCDRFAVRHIERLFQSRPGFWKGIGEVFFRHDDVTHLTYGEPPRPNHPAMQPIYEFAAAHSLPVLFHQDITSPNMCHAHKYLGELKEALKAFPDTRFVWAHCGCSERVRVPEYAALIADMLSAHSNLHADISWAILDDVICKDGVLSQEWVMVIEKYSPRFSLGSDVAGSFHRIPGILAQYTPLLQALSREAHEDVSHRTADALYFSSPA